jgi:hypothetical protein
MNESHLVVAWNGDRIDCIPISFSIDGVSRDTMLINLTTDAVIAHVEKFLEHEKFVRPGLTLCIHSRDPVSE